MSSWSPGYWRKSPVAEAVASREGLGLSRPGGTPRRPRTARTAAKREHRKHGRFVCDTPTSAEVQHGLFRQLLTNGYYDEYRRAFDAADE